jgi:pimeloyl-ACP methyl ester carboxylesterase
MALGGVITVVLLCGVTYQSIATALERRQFQYPGRLIDAGGHQLHIHCTGQGSPVVVLEAAAAGLSAGWAWVQDDVGKKTRVCSYDRAGLGWSEAGDNRYGPTDVPEQLHAVLERSGERGPFIIAGHELGAAFARLYASRFRAETAALVLIDDPSDGPASAPVFSPLVTAWPWLARIGVLRATRTLSKHAAGLPDASRGATRAFLNRPDHLTRSAIEIERWDETVELARSAAIDPSLRVTRVTTSRQEPPALLASADRARTVTRAIEEAITEQRR